jgi:hypothetical protein
MMIRSTNHGTLRQLRHPLSTSQKQKIANASNAQTTKIQIEIWIADSEAHSPAVLRATTLVTRKSMVYLERLGVLFSGTSLRTKSRTMRRMRMMMMITDLSIVTASIINTIIIAIGVIRDTVVTLTVVTLTVVTLTVVTLMVRDTVVIRDTAAKKMSTEQLPG